MNELARTSEAVLYAAYQEQIGHYGNALKAIKDVLATFDQDSGTFCDKLAQIQVFLNEIAANEARIKETKLWWLRTAQKPGPQLRAAVSQITHLIELLAGYVGEAEQAAVARKQSLIPELDNIARGLQMQRAYRSYRAFDATRPRI